MQGGGLLIRSPSGRPVRWLMACALLICQSLSLADTGLLQALTDVPGDALRGRQLVAQRSQSLCLLCHSGPLPEVRFQGNLAPDLSGAGSRNTAAQLRQRLVDSRQINPASVMPPYHATQGLHRVAPAWRDRPILTAQQVEDVVAYLLTLQ
jgi:sulfur-oxidizing protein SoxX